MSNSLIPRKEIQERENSGAISITAITRLKHAELLVTVRQIELVLKKRQLSGRCKFYGKIGGQAAIARILGVTPVEFGQWINLRECPPTIAKGKRWTDRAIMRVEKGLWRLTSKTMEELFPAELRANIQFLAAPKQFERTMEVQQTALQHYAESTRERLLEAQTEPVTAAMSAEVKKNIFKLLLQLTPRERAVISYRYGFNADQACYSLAEIGAMLKVLPERVRQIECKAIRKLQKYCDQKNLSL